MERAGYSPKLVYDLRNQENPCAQCEWGTCTESQDQENQTMRGIRMVTFITILTILLRTQFETTSSGWYVHSNCRQARCELNNSCEVSWKCNEVLWRALRLGLAGYCFRPQMQFHQNGVKFMSSLLHRSCPDFHPSNCFQPVQFSTNLVKIYLAAGVCTLFYFRNWKDCRPRCPLQVSFAK